jgi:hypothetical protein
LSCQITNCVLCFWLVLLVRSSSVHRGTAVIRRNANHQ